MPRLHYRKALALLLFVLAAQSAGAHESWVEPALFHVQVADDITADLRVGRDLKGNRYFYNPDEFTRLELVDSGGSRPIKGRLGDLPAVKINATRDGLHTLIYESTAFSITYKDYATFENFITREGLDRVLRAHEARGLPDKGFTERYWRFAKALIKVGDGAGQDRAAGMRLELIALTNPYTVASNTDIEVQLLWLGRPLASTQVSVHRKSGDAKAVRSTLRSNDEGKVVVPRGEGGRFLLNAVHMIEPPENSAGLVWESLWASMMFEVAN